MAFSHLTDSSNVIETFTLKRFVGWVGLGRGPLGGWEGRWGISVLEMKNVLNHFQCETQDWE